MIVLGVMSGSSLDGIDLAIVDFKQNDDNWSWNLLAQQTEALPTSLKDKLSNIINLDVFQLAQTNSEYTAYIGQTINSLINASKEKPQIIGVHGHTILHLPQHHISWQLLNGGQLTELTQLPVVCDFRNQDMALGGQGTPMAVLCDRDLFSDHDAYLNLGGIANISYQKNESWVGYDIVGCNQFLNYFSAKNGLTYDKDGLLAQSGKSIPNMLDLLNSDPYLQKAIPKSLDNTYLKNIILKLDKTEHKTQDILYTLVDFISTQLAQEIKSASAKSVLLTGGGTKNKFLIKTLESKLEDDNTILHIPDEEIIDYKESILIAYATLLRYHSKPNFVGSATGAEADVTGGALYLPSNHKM